MADLVWVSRSPLRAAAVPGRSGASGARAGVRMREVAETSLVLVMARRGCYPDVVEAAAGHFGAEPPRRPAAVFTKDTALIWAGADQFHVLGPSEGSADRVAALRSVFDGTASLSDQSDGRALIQVSGTHARDTLAKVSSIDLDPAVFAIGAAAITSMDHTNVVLWRSADEDGEAIFNLIVFATFAESLWAMLAGSAAEFGLEVG